MVMISNIVKGKSQFVFKGQIQKRLVIRVAFVEQNLRMRVS
jgi:hypothetical protein